MTELKTLKDLNPAVDINGVEDISCIFVNELRQEAIKWAQYFKEHSKKDGYELYAEDWVKHFFNLTEEDLA